MTDNISQTCTLKTAYKHNLYLFRAEQIRRQNDESCLHERTLLTGNLFGEKPQRDEAKRNRGAALNNYDYKSNKKRQGSIIVFPVSFFYIEPAYNCFAL